MHIMARSLLPAVGNGQERECRFIDLVSKQFVLIGFFAGESLMGHIERPIATMGFVWIWIEIWYLLGNRFYVVEFFVLSKIGSNLSPI